MGKNLEIVDYFKYLGVNFNFNGNFFLNGRKIFAIKVLGPCTLSLTEQDHYKSPYRYPSRIIWQNGTPGLILFMWSLGCRNNAALKRVHLMYCKYILGLSRSTPNCFIYRELGRFPVDIKIKTSIVAYIYTALTPLNWLHLCITPCSICMLMMYTSQTG